MLQRVTCLAATIAAAATSSTTTAAQDGGAAAPVAAGTPAVAPQESGATEVDDTPETVVVGRANDLVGIADAASAGEVGRAQIERRPLLRPGELLETVPGIVITQHSGAGKGNQFFLRGFNLDHGTDLSIRANGVPLNLRSHGHGQGYTDLNPLIPELVESVRFRKGPYFADAGDFSSAGNVAIDYADDLPRGFVLVERGRFDFQRTVAADDFAVGDGRLLLGLELLHHDGPWENEDDYEKISGVTRWSSGSRERGARATLELYDADWTATDHVAKRAVDTGVIGRFGTLDPTSGGESSRQSLSAEVWERDASSHSTLSAYAYRYDLDLFSNFTYFLANPVDGDQILQRDERFVVGLEGAHGFDGDLAGTPSTTLLGFQAQSDWIDNGLFESTQRTVTGTVRDDEIVEASLGVYAEHTLFWNDWLRSVAGLRADHYRFDVDSDLAVNSGRENDTLASPKLGLVFGPFASTEIYVNGGFGFHSNDARGTTLVDDPTTPAPLDGLAVDPLVRQKGVEVGVRTTALEGLQSTLSVWYLESDSELLFVGDAGNTEPSGATQRYGVEWTNYYELEEWLALDFDAAASDARFTDSGPDEHVPGAIDTVLAMGLSTQTQDGHFAALRGRYFGPRDLIEDGSVQSSSSFLVNAHFGYRVDERWQVRLSVFNLFDRDVNDIEYYYPSLLAGEAPGPDDGGYDDIHFHPAEPFALRLGVTATF
jgi:outer membrane receptor protein involved in Fe transport